MKNRANGGGERRVAFVIDNLNSGGAERAALNMASAAHRSRCLVVAERRGGDLTADAEAHIVMFASESNVREARARRVLRLAQALRAAEVDLVVAMLSPMVTAAAAKLLGLPLIHWLQAPWSEVTHATSPGGKGWAHRQALRHAVSGAALVAAATPGLAEECMRLGLPACKLAVLPNGLRLPTAGPLAPSPGATTATIVSVGRLEAPKRHDLTIRAVARIASDTPVRLVLVGSGQDEVALRRLADEVGASSIVEFTGFVASPTDEVVRADVFVLATDYEGFGNVIVEALACGKPVVASDVPYGPRFILGDGEYGDLVAPGSVDALEDAMRRALSRPYDHDAALRACRRAEEFAVDAVASRFEQLVDLLQAGNATVPPSLRAWP
jgi:glycosyltransferase involved in cell wall biosynthesis